MTRSEIEAAKGVDLWADIPDFPRHAWQDEAGAGDTQLGYWDWVESQLSQREDEEGPNAIDALLLSCRDLVALVTRMDVRQHAGLRVTKKDWGVLHSTLSKVNGLFDAWDKENEDT